MSEYEIVLADGRVLRVETVNTDAGTLLVWESGGPYDWPSYTLSPSAWLAFRRVEAAR